MEDRAVSITQTIGLEEVDKLCAAASNVLSDMAVDEKKIIRDIVDKITIYEKGEVEIRGHLPLFDQKLGQYNGNRNSWVAECGEVHVV